MASPHDRDRFSYSLTLSGDWVIQANDTVRPGEPTPAFAFAWKGTEHIRLEDGLLHEAARVDVSGLYYRPFVFSMDEDKRSWKSGNATGWFGPDGAVAYESMGAEGSGYARGSLSPLPGLPPIASSGVESETAVAVRTYGAFGPCLASNVLQGARHSTSGLVSLFGACHLGGWLLGISGDTLWRAAKVEEVAGIQALRFDSVSDPPLQAWFNPAIPYPVQVRFASPPTVDGLQGEGLLRLTGFSPGGVALPAKDVPRDPAPALAWSETMPWGPDDAGVTTPFPLSEAFQRAREDAEFRTLRDFLDEHPQAYTSAAHPTITERRYSYEGLVTRPDGEDRSWTFTLTDADSCLLVEATRSVRPSTLPLGSAQTTYSFKAYNDRDFASAGTASGTALACGMNHPAPAKAPRAWPTAASATALWEAYASSEEKKEGPNGWSFQVVEHEGDVAVLFGAGQGAARGLMVSEPSGYAMSTGTAGAQLNLRDGKVQSYQRASHSVREFHEVAGMSSPAEVASSPAGSIPAPAPEGRLSGAFISAEAAAGVGLLATLAGILYWLWPTLKGAGLAGLFSRVREDDLLRHPVRKEVLHRIEAQPGMHYQELLRAMGGGKGNLEHHLRKLEAGRLVRAVRGPYYTCYFPWTASPAQRDAAPALKSEGARRVLAAVKAHPGITGQGLAAQTGLSASSVSEHVARLSAAGLVRSSRDRRTIRVEPAPQGMAA